MSPSPTGADEPLPRTPRAAFDEAFKYLAIPDTDAGPRARDVLVRWRETDIRPLLTIKPSQVQLIRPTIEEIVESSREEEPLHVERRTIDHLRSSASSEEQIKFAHRVAVTVIASTEKAQTTGGDGQVIFAGLANVRGKLENSLRDKYDVSSHVELTTEQSTTVKVPARTKVIVEIQWQLVWRVGTIRLRGRGSSQDAIVPYRVTGGLAYDTKTFDAD